MAAFPPAPPESAAIRADVDSGILAAGGPWLRVLGGRDRRRRARGSDPGPARLGSMRLQFGWLFDLAAPLVEVATHWDSQRWNDPDVSGYQPNAWASA